MGELIRIFIGIVILLVAFPLGNWLAKLTKEELKAGKKWFKLLIIIALIGSVVSLIMKNDVYLFTFLFIVIIALQSWKRKY